MYESSLLLVDPSAMFNLSSAWKNQMAFGGPGSARHVYRVYTARKLIPQGQPRLTLDREEERAMNIANASTPITRMTWVAWSRGMQCKSNLL